MDWCLKTIPPNTSVVEQFLGARVIASVGKNEAMRLTYMITYNTLLGYGFLGLFKSGFGGDSKC